MSELYKLSAEKTVALLKDGEVSPLELVEAAVHRIEETDEDINAMPTLCVDRACEHARRIMDGKQDGGLLGGLPIAVKDLNDVVGVRTTYGSPIYSDHVPTRSDILVERLEENGAIVIGKANTPEFGAGASTFNEVFGKTRNPWNTSKSVAGSSGGSAATLAAGQVWLATGSDLAGSLRTPASFNSVIGFRPSPGRVIHSPSDLRWQTLAVNGPMARTVADTALFLDAMAGEHREDPLARPRPTRSFLDQTQSARAPKRIAFSSNLGIIAVDQEVSAICEDAANQFSAIGTSVEKACPDFSEAIDCFQTLRAAMYAANHYRHLHEKRDLLKPEIIWNIEKGLALKVEDIVKAELQRSRIFRNVVSFFETYDFLLCPTAIVPPYEVGKRYVEEANGYRFDNYVHWLCLVFALTLTGCPVISVPAGFTKTGLPVGVQIMGPPHADGAVLGAAALLEQMTGIAQQLPIDPRVVETQS